MSGIHLVSDNPRQLGCGSRCSFGDAPMGQPAVTISATPTRRTSPCRFGINWTPPHALAQLIGQSAAPSHSFSLEPLRRKADNETQESLAA